MRTNREWWICLLRDGVGVAAVVPVAAAVGFGVNLLRTEPLTLHYLPPSERIERAAQRLTPATVPSVTGDVGAPVTLDEMRSLVAASDVVLIDARPEIFWRLGHIPGALSLPRETFEARAAELKARLDGTPDARIVVYCAAASCEDATMVVNGLRRMGYANVRRFHGGWAEWERAGLESHSGG